MIESAQSLCHKIQGMSISEQLHWALVLATVGGAIGICLRELTSDRELRLFGLLLGLGAYFIMASFGIHATHVCENFNLSKQMPETMTGRGVSLLADGETESRQSPSSFPAVIGGLSQFKNQSSEYQFTSKEGHTLKWSCPNASATTTTGSTLFHAMREGN